MNWRSDDDVLPEMLPKNLREKSDEEIQKAVFDAYTNQMKIVSEYSGHVYDPTYPFGYFKNEYFVPNTYAYQSDGDLVFYNNVVRGLRDFTYNDIIIRWAPDQVETIVPLKCIQFFFSSQYRILYTYSRVIPNNIIAVNICGV